MKNLKDLIVGHDNDYGFLVSEVMDMHIKRVPNLSIVIPYYETGAVFSTTLLCLFNAIQRVKKQYPGWRYEVLVVDDGSQKKKAGNFLGEHETNIQLILQAVNMGRTRTRNTGLRNAKYEKCLFMDSDILITDNFLLSHLKVHSFAALKDKKVITVGFFQFIESTQDFSLSLPFLDKDIELNDFRLDCIYGPTWIGCENDKQFIGTHFQIVKETHQFKSWPNTGFFGPWFLTNMVLGGFFMVDTKQALEVDGFDEGFDGYGFTETSLPTKLVAGLNTYIVPVIFGGGIHITDDEINVSRQDKDVIFRKKHDYYFNKYLHITWEQALKGYGR